MNIKLLLIITLSTCFYTCIPDTFNEVQKEKINIDSISDQSIIPIVEEDSFPTPSTDDVYKLVESMPRFPGCEDLKTKEEKKACSDGKIVEFILKHLKYPAIARESTIEGTVVIRFVVEKDGSLSNYKVLREPGGGMGEEAVRVIKSMPKWISGKQQGKPVRVQFTFPIKIGLSE